MASDLPSDLSRVPIAYFRMVRSQTEEGKEEAKVPEVEESKVGERIRGVDR